MLLAPAHSRKAAAMSPSGAILPLFSISKQAVFSSLSLITGDKHFTRARDAWVGGVLAEASDAIILMPSTSANTHSPLIPGILLSKV